MILDAPLSLSLWRETLLRCIGSEGEYGEAGSVSEWRRGSADRPCLQLWRCGVVVSMSVTARLDRSAVPRVQTKRLDNGRREQLLKSLGVAIDAEGSGEPPDHRRTGEERAARGVRGENVGVDARLWSGPIKKQIVGALRNHEFVAAVPLRGRHEIASDEGKCERLRSVQVDLLAHASKDCFHFVAGVGGRVAANKLFVTERIENEESDALPVEGETSDQSGCVEKRSPHGKGGKGRPDLIVETAKERSTGIWVQAGHDDLGLAQALGETMTSSTGRYLRHPQRGPRSARRALTPPRAQQQPRTRRAVSCAPDRSYRVDAFSASSGRMIGSLWL